MSEYSEKIELLKKEIMKEAEFFCNQLDCLDESLPVVLQHEIKNEMKGFTISICVKEFW
ncbi:MAG: hypothetical protein KAR40_13805 [Candidatus Sabulitectum sp.]|nr:hypothetical protein [Candidatus Sabulitectum sp.]